MLADAARDLSDDGVSFLGINNRDYDEASARRFTENFDIPYPSLYDPEGNLLLNFRGTLPPLAAAFADTCSDRARSPASVAGFGGSSAAASAGITAAAAAGGALCSRRARLSDSHVSHFHCSRWVRPYTRRREIGQ